MKLDQAKRSLTSSSLKLHRLGKKNYKKITPIFEYVGRRQVKKIELQENHILQPLSVLLLIMLRLI